ncbi:Hypothetical predicted protein [Xyrichtys novacula]|uniref:Uncharacterized protein n=1 Tax=Xyrichtys novacula TaxID=13765 RepID=A0AAV1HRF6_XYRNO|nr:Hypothetical predicted protein [Xyrichtys novacula]
MEEEKEAEKEEEPPRRRKPRPGSAHPLRLKVRGKAPERCEGRRKRSVSSCARVVTKSERGKHTGDHVTGAHSWNFHILDVGFVSMRRKTEKHQRVNTGSEAFCGFIF